MGINLITYQIVNEFKDIEEVIAITLSGSGASGRNDMYSDIDISIITSKYIDEERRRNVIKKFADSMEIGNELNIVADEFILRNSSIQIDIQYFTIDFLTESLSKVVDDCTGNVGYSTCIWNNVINSVLVFQRDGRFKNLQDKYRVEYPKELIKDIISKNYPLLRNSFSSYYNQIEKAILRKDIVSISHMISAYLNSYFDILFALNRMPHPGDKRLLTIVESSCKIKPQNLATNIAILLENIPNCHEKILNCLNELVDNLDILITSEVS